MHVNRIIAGKWIVVFFLHFRHPRHPNYQVPEMALANRHR